MNNVMCIAVHPDDETLGCGGTLLKHLAAGDRLNWLIITEMKDFLGFTEESIVKRKTEIEQVARYYGFTEVIQLRFPTTCLDKVGQREIVGSISEAVGTVAPDILYLPYYRDAQSDHRVAFEASISCLKSFRRPSVIRALMMETPSETDYSFPVEHGFNSNYYVDITSHFEGKLEAMKIYESEYGIAPFPRSEGVLRALATIRGSFIGREYAESFVSLKDVWL